MRISAVLVLALSSAVIGRPAPEASFKKHPGFRPPGPNDVRSPCPMLDSLANHDILPHSGKDITIEKLKPAFKDYINVGHDVATVVGAMGIAISPKKNSFDLNDLDLHDAIEHDGSISRDDAYFGNDHTFNGTIFAQASQFFQKSSITIEDAALARITRHKISSETNPHYRLSKAHRMGSYTEAAFYLSIFGNPHTGLVEESHYVKYWFRNRRLPYAIGWLPRKEETNLTTLTALSKKVHHMTPKIPGTDEEGFEFVPH